MMKTIVWRKHLLLLTIACFMGLAASCSTDKTTSNDIEIDEYIHEDIRSDCLNREFSSEPYFGYMVLEVDGNDLHILHLSAYYQCCLEYDVNYIIDNFDITATESDTAPSPCYCTCYFNLESILYDLENGVYAVTLIGVFGDTVGVDSATVGE